MKQRARNANRGRGWRRLSLLLLIGLGLSMWATLRVLDADVQVGDRLDAWLPTIHLMLFGSIGLQALVAGLAAVRAVRGDPSPAPPMRLVVYVLAIATLLFLGFVQPFWRFYFDIGLGFAFGVCALVVGPIAWIGQRVLPTKLLSSFDLVAINLLVIVAVSEVALRVWYQVSPNPLLAPLDGTTLRRLEQHALRPGAIHLGFAANERGDYDEAWADHVPEQDQRLVVCVGDSFSIGKVPHHYHYTTVCERELGKTRVYNAGAGGIGPYEYLYLLRNDLAALEPKPAAYVVALFVGNDIAEAGKGRVADRMLRSVFDRGNVRLYMLPHRLLKLRNAGVQVDDEGQTLRVIDKPGMLKQAFPWLDDPKLEPPYFNEATHLRLEVDRAHSVQATRKDSYSLLKLDLREMKAVCGETPLLIVVIPDEFQIDDGLWRRVVDEHAESSKKGDASGGDKPPPLDRDIAQREIAKICKTLELPMLDLLPALRAIPKDGEGKRRLYHLRDTHFNRRGNEVAGKALAEFLRAQLDG